MDFRVQIAGALEGVTGMDTQTILELMTSPPSPKMGDYAFPCFKLAKTLRKAPPAIAAELCEKIALPACVEKCEAQGPYINFFARRGAYAEDVLSRVLNANGQSTS